MSRPRRNALTLTMLAAAMGAIAECASAEEVLIYASRDNTLIQSADGGVSNGAGTVIRSGRTGNNGGNKVLRAVMYFDISEVIPVDATVTSARLELSLLSSSSGAISMSIYEMTASWGEGASDSDSGLGAPSETNDATWLHRFYPSVLWTTPGGDFNPTALASQSVSTGIATYVWTSASLGTTVQQWISTPASNFGLILRGNESSSNTAKGFASREFRTVSLRPRLVINYELPAEPCVGDLVTSDTFQPPPDGQVDGADLAYLLGEWGPNPGSIADIVDTKTFQPPPDGVVDGADLAYLLGAWGSCP